MGKPISVVNVALSYPAKTERVLAIGDVSLELAAGSFTALVGPTGCGKSSLLRTVAGLERPTAGTVSVGDRRIQGPSIDVGMVFQEPALLPWRNLVDNISFGLEIAGRDRKSRRERARELIRTVGLGGFEEAFPHQLSGGMQQRAAVARALALDPSVLLLDEPFGALDEQTRLLLGLELLRVWGQTDMTVVLVTHSIQEAVLLADSVVVLSRRPSEVRATFPVDLPRPRDVTHLASPELNKIQVGIWECLREESLAAMEPEQPAYSQAASARE
jgi:NitT/TauT family transport system ATP-binding protein